MAITVATAGILARFSEDLTALELLVGLSTTHRGLYRFCLKILPGLDSILVNCEVCLYS